MTEEDYIYFYKPEGVTDFLGLGISSWVGIVDETTVLKFPKTIGDKEDLTMLDLEAQMLAKIGPHKHIIGLKGRREDGLLLERARHGTIAQYLKDHAPSTQQRISWARQTTEAIAVTHSAGVIHCDISCNNLLLDDELTVKLCDFQGLLLRPDGSVERGGQSQECTKSTMPRADINHSDRKTDIFALGSALYYIMEGHQPFPDLTSSDEEEIEARFRSSQFPEMISHLMQRVTHKCWAGEYESAEAVLNDLGSDDSSIVGVGDAGNTGHSEIGSELHHSNPVVSPHI